MSSEIIDIIIPVYNEEEALPLFYQQLQALPVSVHPIFINNGSTDNSATFLSSLKGVTIITLETNQGYGGALRTGIHHTTSEKIIIIDADGEYLPEVIPQIVHALDDYDVVHTSRFLGTDKLTMSGFRSTGNKCITSIFNLLFDQQLTDLYTGCKGYRREKVDWLDLERNGFEHVLEISAKLVWVGVQIHEVPVKYIERKSGVSKMNHLVEALKYGWLVLYYYFSLKKEKGRKS